MLELNVYFNASKAFYILCFYWYYGKPPTFQFKALYLYIK